VSSLKFLPADTSRKKETAAPSADSQSRSFAIQSPRSWPVWWSSASTTGKLINPQSRNMHGRVNANDPLYMGAGRRSDRQSVRPERMAHKPGDAHVGRGSSLAGCAGGPASFLCLDRLAAIGRAPEIHIALTRTNPMERSASAGPVGVRTSVSAENRPKVAGRRFCATPGAEAALRSSPCSAGAAHVHDRLLPGRVRHVLAPGSVRYGPCHNSARALVLNPA